MKNKICIYILFQFLIFNFSFSEVIKKIKINGNNRVSNETVIMFSNLKVGDDIDKDDLNDSLKEIYLTDYFKDVKISFSEGIVNINVQENPIVKSVTINGIKKKKINEKISEITSKIEKYPFVENKINNQVKLLKNILKTFGYYFVELKTSISSNDDSTVNLVFDILE